MAEKPREAGRREGMGMRQWLFVAAGILLVLFFVLNFQSVEVSLIVATVDMPLIVALGIAALLGALVGWALPLLHASRAQ
jgi:uncharacterized integral membrane protein